MLKKMNHTLWLFSMILTGTIMGFVFSHSLILGPWFTWFVTEPGKIEILYKTYSEFRAIHPPTLYNSLFIIQFFVITLFLITSLISKYRRGFSLAAFIASFIVGIIHFGSGFGKLERLVLSGVVRDASSISKYAAMNVPIHLFHSAGLLIAFICLCIYFKNDNNLNKKRIEENTSRTAEWTCVCRALSSYEKKKQLKSDDFIAPKILPAGLTPFIKIKLFRDLFIKILIPKGLYEYVIVRTKYFDQIFKDAMADNYEQILIFGAGFDSRGLRLVKSNNKVTVFELDSPTTQHNKLEQFKNRHIEIPKHMKYIPIDFMTDSLENKLLEYNFDFHKKTLFLMEGLIMYLNLKSISETFSILQKNKGFNSRILFDYVYDSVIRHNDGSYGGEEAFQTVKNAGEEWTFGIKKGDIDNFLHNYNLRLIEEKDIKMLEEKYFDGLNIRINEAHSIVLAEVL